jgi:hypothetical protein
MPKAQPAIAGNPVPNQRLVTELKVSGHLMTLESGLFCILQTPSRAADPASGLPGVRISLPPGSASRPDAVTVTSFRPDGWLSGGGDAALVRVLGGPAQILVTVYQVPNATEGAPNLQVMRLLEAGPRGGAQSGQPAPVVVAQPAPGRVTGQPAVMEMVAHIRERGDVGAMIGDWVGERGSKRWIEGFGIAPISGISIKDIEYQAVLGRGWLSPWVDGGQFCGSRGMALPILGLRVRLRGEAAATHEVSYSATFIDGSEIGPVDAGEACEAESLAPVEAFQVVLRAKRAAAGPVAAEPEAEESEAEPPATAAAARPAAHKPAKVEPKGKAKAKLPPRGHAR